MRLTLRMRAGFTNIMISIGREFYYSSTAAVCYFKPVAFTLVALTRRVLRYLVELFVSRPCLDSMSFAQI